MHQPLNVDIFESDGVVVLTIEGEIDVSACEQVADAIERSTHRAAHAVVLDLGGVAYLDSPGLLVLLAGGRAAERQRVRFVLGRSSPAVDGVLERFGMDERRLISAAPGGAG